MPPGQSDRRKGSKAKSQSQSQRTRQSKQPTRLKPSNDKPKSQSTNPSLDFNTAIPISLQQLVLDVFKTALLTSNPASASARASQDISEDTPQDEELDTKTLIQTIKTHLYQRDFDSAFTDAGEDLLRAYALRWSAARALGYAGLFRTVLKWMENENGNGREKELDTISGTARTRVVCIGGGAGAEIVALAAAWRSLRQEEGQGLELGSLSLEDTESKGETEVDAEDTIEAVSSSPARGLSVAAVDIADWSGVVRRLERTIASDAVYALRSSEYQPPLVPSKGEGDGDGGFSVSFRKDDVLGVPEDQLKDVLLDTGSSSILVTLMFTLNELFSTSMAKTTGFLLRMTEILPSNAVLFVVDSPGSYSTLKMGKDKDGAPVERNYPMKFLLDHTLLSVAEGKWERIYTEDSRWWRRDAEQLRYKVGEGAGLEDMRFQVHLYRRL
ncbi:hypothetical protein N7533_009670 [Penicillium manginii]|jgi:25S rRNA (uracil2843-N3)-methyltransferase|uniref:uncharacterized protein n=1 Tax=Penicillium manginii TaxID=203109 RepID=UPI002547F675|nr:uncharacterized protein N7533_009670 [Penicillium manginii]KAJ5744800.1 hypothetical protein N7533_009670 [Penicillium manginii]